MMYVQLLLWQSLSYLQSAFYDRDIAFEVKNRACRAAAAFVEEDLPCPLPD